MEPLFLFIPKKVDALGENKYKIVADIRKLNDITAGYAFLKSDVTTILDQLGKAKYFSCLNMASEYHQVPIHHKDRQKIAFSIESGYYEFIRMYFGLKVAPVIYQRIMNRLLETVNGFKVFVQV